MQLKWQVNGGGQPAPAFVSELQAALTPFKGGNCMIGIDYCSNQASANLRLSEEWRVHPTDELLSRLKRLPGAVSVNVVYQ